MISLFPTINRLHPTLIGWCPHDKAITLAAFVISLRPAITVEIGVWGGRSLIPMAMAHKAIGYGTVVGIDPWDPRASAKNEAPVHAAHWANANHEAVYQRFAATVKNLGLLDHVKVLRQTSDSVVPPSAIDLLHVDGNHTEQAIRDVTRFADRVRVGGICVMDDLEWGSGAVKLAENRLLQMKFRKLYALGTGAVYQRLA